MNFLLKNTLIHVNLARGYRGGERQTELLIKALSQQGFSQVFVGKKNQPLLEKCAAYENVKVVPIRTFLQGHYKKLGELVHVHEAKAVYWAWLHRKLWRTPYLITRRVPYRVGSRWITRRAYLRSSALVGVSRSVGKVLEKQLEIPIDTILDCHSNFIPQLENVQKIRQSLGGTPIIGHVGALVDSHKGQSTLLHAFKEISSTYPNARLLLVGDGPDRTYFEGLSNGNPRIVFAGFQTNVADYIAAMDCFVFPSNEEGLGSSLLDAMHLGVPVVASNVGGIPEIIDDQRGELVPPGDAKKLAEAVVGLLKDEKKRKAYVESGLAFAARCTPEKMTAAYLNRYQTILGFEKLSASPEEEI